MDWFDTGDAVLRYAYRGGEGPCLVLIHEMGGSLESWDLVLPTLPPDCAVLLAEMRGMGCSQRLTEVPSFALIARDILALLDHLDLRDPVVAAGCAVGGGVALQLALDAPDRVAAVVPLDPAIDLSPAGTEGAPGLARLMAEQGMRAVEATLLDRTYPSRYRDRDPEHFSRVRGRWYANDPVSFGNFFLMLAQTDLKPRLQDVTCPVHFGAGSHDTLRPPEYVAALADLTPNSTVTALDAGHHVADHAPGEVAALLCRTREQVRARAA